MLLSPLRLPRRVHVIRLALLRHARKTWIEILLGFEESQDRGFSTISNDKVRFVAVTEAYGAWWRRNRRPRRRERLAMLKRQGKIPKSV